MLGVIQNNNTEKCQAQLAHFYLQLNYLLLVKLIVAGTTIGSSQGRDNVFNHIQFPRVKRDIDGIQLKRCSCAILLPGVVGSKKGGFNYLRVPSRNANYTGSGHTLSPRNAGKLYYLPLIGNIPRVTRTKSKGFKQRAGFNRCIIAQLCAPGGGSTQSSVSHQLREQLVLPFLQRQHLERLPHLSHSQLHYWDSGAAEKFRHQSPVWVKIHTLRMSRQEAHCPGCKGRMRQRVPALATSLSAAPHSQLVVRGWQNISIWTGLSLSLVDMLMGLHRQSRIKQ